MPKQSTAIQDGIDLEELRAHLRKMTDTELRRFRPCRPIHVPLWSKG